MYIDIQCCLYWISLSRFFHPTMPGHPINWWGNSPNRGGIGEQNAVIFDKQRLMDEAASDTPLGCSWGLPAWDAALNNSGKAQWRCFCENIDCIWLQCHDRCGIWQCTASSHSEPPVLNTIWVLFPIYHLYVAGLFAQLARLDRFAQLGRLQEETRPLPRRSPIDQAPNTAPCDMLSGGLRLGWGKEPY